MSEYSLKSTEIKRSSDSTAFGKGRQVPSVEQVYEEPLHSLERRSIVSQWSEPEIIHQLAILVMTKPDRVKSLFEQMAANTAYWQNEYSTSIEAQLVYEAKNRNIDPYQARRTLTSI